MLSTVSEKSDESAISEFTLVNTEKQFDFTAQLSLEHMQDSDSATVGNKTIAVHKPEEIILQSSDQHDHLVQSHDAVHNLHHSPETFTSHKSETTQQYPLTTMQEDDLQNASEADREIIDHQQDFQQETEKQDLKQTSKHIVHM